MKKTSELQQGEKVLLPNRKGDGSELLTVLSVHPFTPGPRNVIANSLGNDTIMYLRSKPTWLFRKGRVVTYGCKATKVWINEA